MIDGTCDEATVRLACRESGRGRPVVLLHGTGDDAGTWDGLGWPEGWRVLALDLRGHGSSPRPGCYPLPVMAGDVIITLDGLGVDDFDLVGHSMGGMVAYLVAQRWPGRVRRLVLVEPPPPVPAEPPRDEGPRPDRELAYDWEFQPQFSAQRNAPDPAWWDGLARITAPTLLLAGSGGSFPSGTLRAMAELIPGCRLETLDGGHLLHHDQPGAVTAAVAAFLDVSG